MNPYMMSNDQIYNQFQFPHNNPAYLRFTDLNEIAELTETSFDTSMLSQSDLDTSIDNQANENFVENDTFKYPMTDQPESNVDVINKSFMEIPDQDQVPSELKNGIYFNNDPTDEFRPPLDFSLDSYLNKNNQQELEFKDQSKNIDTDTNTLFYSNDSSDKIATHQEKNSKYLNQNIPENMSEIIHKDKNEKIDEFLTVDNYDQEKLDKINDNNIIGNDDEEIDKEVETINETPVADSDSEDEIHIDKGPLTELNSNISFVLDDDPSDEFRKPSQATLKVDKILDQPVGIKNDLKALKLDVVPTEQLKKSPIVFKNAEIDEIEKNSSDEHVDFKKVLPASKFKQPPASIKKLSPLMKPLNTATKIEIAEELLNEMKEIQKDTPKLILNDVSNNETQEMPILKKEKNEGKVIEVTVDVPALQLDKNSKDQTDESQDDLIELEIDINIFNDGSSGELKAEIDVKKGIQTREEISKSQSNEQLSNVSVSEELKLEESKAETLDRPESITSKTDLNKSFVNSEIDLSERFESNSSEGELNKSFYINSESDISERLLFNTSEVDLNKSFYIDSETDDDGLKENVISKDKILNENTNISKDSINLNDNTNVSVTPKLNRTVVENDEEEKIVENRFDELPKSIQEINIQEDFSYENLIAIIAEKTAEKLLEKLRKFDTKAELPDENHLDNIMREDNSKNAKVKSKKDALQRKKNEEEINKRIDMIAAMYNNAKTVEQKNEIIKQLKD